MKKTEFKLVFNESWLFNGLENSKYRIISDPIETELGYEYIIEKIK